MGHAGLSQLILEFYGNDFKFIFNDRINSNNFNIYLDYLHLEDTIFSKLLIPMNPSMEIKIVLSFHGNQFYISENTTFLALVDALKCIGVCQSLIHFDMVYIITYESGNMSNFWIQDTMY